MLVQQLRGLVAPPPAGVGASLGDKKFNEQGIKKQGIKKQGTKKEGINNLLQFKLII